MTDDFRSPVPAAGASELLSRARARLARERERPRRRDSGDQSIDLASDGALIGGWYPLETVGESRIRWVKRRFHFEANPFDATHVLLDACLFPESGFYELRARLRAGDRAGGAVRLVPDWNVALFPIPAGSTGRLLFSIDAGGSWSPAASGASSDDRELSLAVRRLELVRLPRLPRAAAEPPEPAAVATAAAGPRADGLLLRSVRAVRRRLLGWELPARVSSSEERIRALESKMTEAERRANQSAAIVEQSVEALSAALEELRRDMDEREEEWRQELSRRLSPPGPTV